MHNSSEHLWYLVSLKLSGEAGPEDLAELDRLLKASPEAVFQVEMLERLWRQKNELPPQKINESYSRHLQRLSNHLAEPALQYTEIDDLTLPETETPVQNTRWWWIGGIAASLLVGIVLFFTLGNKQDSKVLSQNVVSTRLGSKSKVQLPDGTIVHLNSGSLLTYDQAFNGKIREVRLSGEAYFDVAHNKDRPFIIHTASVDIKVLGTAFNVRAYPDEQTTETALIRGSVEVMLLDNPDKKTVLKPSEKLVVQNKKDTVAKQEVAATMPSMPLVTISRVRSLEKDSTVLETSWVDNKIAFDNESLETIAQKLERWYDVHIIITDEDLKREIYNATFEGESLEEVLNSLKLAGGFSFVINKKEVRIMP